MEERATRVHMLQMVKNMMPRSILEIYLIKRQLTGGQNPDRGLTRLFISTRGTNATLIAGKLQESILGDFFRKARFERRGSFVETERQ